MTEFKTGINITEQLEILPKIPSHDRNMSWYQFIEEVHEIAFGDNAINREFPLTEVVAELRRVSDKAYTETPTLTEKTFDTFFKFDSEGCADGTLYEVRDGWNVTIEIEDGFLCTEFIKWIMKDDEGGYMIQTMIHDEEWMEIELSDLDVYKKVSKD